MKARDNDAAQTEFVEQARQHFEQSVDNLDAATRSRLNRGRQAALAELGPGKQIWWRSKVATVVAAGAFVAILMVRGDPSPDALTPMNLSADIEILFTEDSFEMLQDLEFYSWIDLGEETDEILAPGGHVG